MKIHLLSIYYTSQGPDIEGPEQLVPGGALLFLLFLSVIASENAHLSHAPNRGKVWRHDQTVGGSCGAARP